MLRNFTLEMRRTFIFHAIASHFVNGLIPVAVLFMLLTLVTADIYFEHTVIHLIGISSLTVPASFVSGIRDWRIKFKGIHAPIFYRKIKLSIILTLLCFAILLIRILWPNSLATGGIIGWLYAVCIAMTLPIVILLGHYGGKLANVLRQKPECDDMLGGEQANEEDTPV